MSMKASKKKRPSREKRVFKYEEKLEEGVFDHESLIVLSRFMTKGIFETLDYCIAKGKEANVYRATTKDGKYIAIKIYRLRSPSFKHMQKYIEGDRRFQKADRGKYGIVFTWTRKEFANLKLMQKLGIHSPKPIAFKHNILAMEFLGVNGIPYSRLSEIGTENPDKDYELILKDIEKMHKNGLVHCDLSEYNIMMCDKGPYLIDVGQAVLTSHSSANEFYLRDLYNLKKFFSKFDSFSKK